MSPAGTPAMAEPLRQQQRPIRHANTPVRALEPCSHRCSPALPHPKGENDTQQEAKQVAQWAAISIPQPIFSEGGTADLQISFGLVNDGSLTVNPKIGSSHLLINGAEPKDWPIVINNGIRTLEFTALHPDTLCDLVMCLAAIFRSRVSIRWDGGAKISEHSQSRSVSSPALAEGHCYNSADGESL